MRRSLMAFAALAVFCGGATAQEVEGYLSGRSGLVDLHRDEREGPWRPGQRAVEALCGCEVDPRGLRIADPFRCAALKESTDDTDGDIVALPLVDATSAAERLECARVGGRFCVDPKTGLKLRGASCCQRDATYVTILQDPHLSLLTPRIVARRVQGLRPALAASPAAKPDICGIRIDRSAGTFALPEYMSGFAARAWLHGSMSYRIDPPGTLGEVARVALSQPPIEYEMQLSRAGRRLARQPQRAVEAQIDRLAPLDIQRR